MERECRVPKVSCTARMRAVCRANTFEQQGRPTHGHLPKQMPAVNKSALTTKAVNFRVLGV